MDIVTTTERIRSLHSTAAALIAEADASAQSYARGLAIGNHQGATVYKVRQTRIRAHTRRGYTATRCR